MKTKRQTTITRSILLGILLLAPIFAKAADLTYDWLAEQRKEALREWIFQTRACMASGTQSKLWEGMRDSEKIMDWVVNACGGHLGRVLTEGMGRPKAETDLFLRAMAQAELNRIPGLRRSTPTPASRQQVEWNKPATLSGTFHSGSFDACCEKGQPIRSRYFFIRLPNKLDVISQEDSEFSPTIRNVETVQLGVSAASFGNVKEGQAITVSCKPLWFGNTGHYALPVYCRDASLRSGRN